MLSRNAVSSEVGSRPKKANTWEGATHASIGCAFRSVGKPSILLHVTLLQELLHVLCFPGVQLMVQLVQ